MNLDVYISYSIDNESVEIAKKICKLLQDEGIKTIYDKYTIAYKESIKNFVKQLAQGNFIILIISNEYLKSDNCMNEIIEIKTFGKMWERVYPVVLDNVNINDEILRIDFINYWDTKIENLNQKYRTIKNPYETTQVLNTINKYNEIRRNIDYFTNLLNEKKKLSIKQLDNENYISIINLIKNGYKEDVNLSIKHFQNKNEVTKNDIITYKTLNFQNDLLDKEEGTNYLFENLPPILQLIDNGSGISIILFDIDDLTIINKVYGKNIGDIIINEIINILKSFKSIIRFGRCGDDTFYSIMIKNENPQRMAKLLKNKIKNYSWDNIISKLSVTCSFGYAVLIFNELIEDMIIRAAIGMNKAKDRGKNKVCEGPKYLLPNQSRELRTYCS